MSTVFINGAPAGIFRKLEPRSLDLYFLAVFSGRKQAVDGTVIIREVRKVLIRTSTSRLMTMSETHSVDKAAGVELHLSALIHFDKVFNVVENSKGAQMEEICYLQDISSQSVGRVSPLQQIQSLREKAGLDAASTTLKAQKLIAQ